MENVFGKRRVLKRFLLSCIAIFLIPFLTILLIYNSASAMIRDEIIRSSNNSLYQFFSTLDACLSEACTAASQVASSPAFLNYAALGQLNSPAQGTTAYKLRSDLQARKSVNFEDIFVYLPLSDFIVSQNKASVDARTFWQSYYADFFPSWEEFEAFLSTDARAQIALLRYAQEGAAPNTSRRFPPKAGGERLSFFAWRHPQDTEGSGAAWRVSCGRAPLKRYGPMSASHSGGQIGRTRLP